MVEATKWAQLTKVEQQIDNFVMRIHVLYIPSLYYHLTMCERQRQKINDCKFCIFYSFQLRKKSATIFCPSTTAAKKRRIIKSAKTRQLCERKNARVYARRNRMCKQANVTRFGDFSPQWQNFIKKPCNHFQCSISVWKKFEPTLAMVYY